MKTTGEERIDVAHGLRDDEGGTIEPEAQPARIVTGVESTVKVGSGPDDPHAQPVGQIAAALVEESNAISVARQLGTRCQFCVHWRRNDWTKLRAKMSHPLNVEGRKILDAMRSELLALARDGETPPGLENGEDSLDVEHAIAAAFGICAALTEIEREPIFTVYNGSCPTHDFKGRPLASMFSERKDGVKSATTAVYDRVLRMAQGRE